MCVRSFIETHVKDINVFFDSNTSILAHQSQNGHELTSRFPDLGKRYRILFRKYAIRGEGPDKNGLRLYKAILICLIRAGPGCLPKFAELKPLFEKLQELFKIFGKDAPDSVISDATDNYRTANHARTVRLAHQTCLGILYVDS